MNTGWLVEAIRGGGGGGGGGTSLNSPGGPFYMIPGGIIGHEGGPCIILLLVPLGPVNIIFGLVYLVWGYIWSGGPILI